MGYSITLYAADVDAVLSEFTSPSLPWDEVEDIASEFVDNARQWKRLQKKSVRDARSRTPVQFEEEHDTYLEVVLETLAEPVADFSFNSAGFCWFRDDVVAGLLGGVIGTQQTDHLLNRDIRSLRDPDERIGYLSAAEVVAAAALTERSSLPATDPAAEAELETLVQAIATAAAQGTGLFSRAV